MRRLLLALIPFFVFLGIDTANAQNTVGLCTWALTNGVVSCTNVSANEPLPVTGSITISGIATAANQATEIGLLTTISTQAVTACNAAPVVSSTAEASHVLKAGAGSLCGVYAINLTSTPGFLVVVNATSAPSDGGITPLACVPLQANGIASLNFGFGAQSTYGTGITAIITSATTCFTKTTGVITGYIAGQVL